MSKLVSIIIPAYNMEKYLDETVQAVFNQTYTNWEVVIVSDGSADNTEKIAKSYLNDDRVRYLFQQNKGVSAARNNGVKQAKGEYLVFLDADDVWKENNLEKKIELLDKHPEIDWVYSNIYYIDEDSNKMHYPERGTDNNILDNILLWNREVVPVPCSNIVLRRKCIEAGVEFDTDFSTAADQYFCLQLASKFKGKIIPERLLYYRVSNKSMSSNISLMERDEIAVYKKASENKWFKSFVFKQRCFSNMYLILAGSWWKEGNNKMRGFWFLIKSILLFPPNIIKIMGKLFN